MALPLANSLRAAVQGGSFAGIAAPLLWPLVLLLDPPPSQGGEPASLVQGLLLIALLALVAGIAVSVFVGFPALLVLVALRLAYPPVVALVGAGLAVPVVFGFFSWPQPSLSLVLFSSIVGALCGWVAGRQLRSGANAL